jgi:hypothetical protein
MRSKKKLSRKLKNGEISDFLGIKEESDSEISEDKTLITG